jgi:hypothetical protein
VALSNRKYEFVFIHVYKTAGMAIRAALPGGNEVMGGHAPATWVRDAFERNKWTHFWNKWTKFGVVRNPFDWMVSLKYYITQNPTNWAHEETTNMTMAQFLKWHERTEKTMTPFVNGHQLGTLSKFLCDEDGKLLVDVVLRQERLDEDFSALQKRLGLPKISLERKNVTAMRKRRDYRSYFNQESRRLVERIFAEDLERFNYSW